MPLAQQEEKVWQSLDLFQIEVPSWGFAKLRYADSQNNAGFGIHSASAGDLKEMVLKKGFPPLLAFLWGRPWRLLLKPASLGISWIRIGVESASRLFPQVTRGHQII